MPRKSQKTQRHRTRRKVSRSVTRQRSFRISVPVLDRLEKRAQLKDASANSLAQQFIDEGLRMDIHPQIFFREGAAGRRPALTGTRLDVWQVIETLRENDNSVEDTAEYLDVPQNRVKAAVRYYAEYQDEVDRFAERMREIANREEEIYQREQEVLG